MPLFTLVFWLILMGVAVYLIGLIPMDGTIRRIIQVVIIVAIVLWVISAIAPSGGPVIHLPHQ